MRKDYNIPPTKKGKVELLESIMKGEKSIDDLKEAGYEVTLWREDPNNPGFMQTFLNGPGGSGVGTSISKEEYEVKMKIGKAIHVTLELNPKSY